MTNPEKLLKEWNELYDLVFPPLKKKYDAVCKLFTDWNSGKINTETALRKLRVLMKKKQTENLSEEAIWEIGRVDPDVAGKYIQKLGRKE